MKEKIVLTTMPVEGQYVNWTTPSYYQPSTMWYMPLGILSIATNIVGDYDIVVLDPASERWSIQETIERIEREKPDVLGLSVVTQRVYAMNQILKNTTAKYKVVGGPHALNNYHKILQHGADAVFSGHLADLEFNEAIKTKRKGVIFCKTQINEIKFPDRRLLNVKNYFPGASVLFKSDTRLPMFTSVGCPNHCTFCDVQTKKTELKSPSLVVDEMQYLHSLGSNSIHILDDNFNVNEKHVHSILDEMDRRNFSIEWSGRGQARMSEELAKRLAEHNFKRIHVGIESLSDDVLHFFRKPIRFKHIKQFCSTMNKYKIEMIAYFILGAPVETQEYLDALPRMIRELGITMPYFNILFPAPSTEYYHQLLYNRTYSKDYWNEYLKNPTPDFCIPPPYGQEKYDKIVSYANNLIKQFEKNDKGND